MTLKPNIANPEVEFDVREIAGVPEQDWDELVTWPDTSGQGNNGTGQGFERRFEEFGIDGTLPQVRLRGPSSPVRLDNFSFDGAPFLNTDVTFFAVISAIDLSIHLPILGSTTAEGVPRQFQLFIRSNGAIVFNRSNDPYDIISATGVIVEGSLYVITARLNGLAMILRVNGTQVGSATGGQIVSWLNPRLFNIRDLTAGGIGSTLGRDKAASWISGYSSAATDQQVIDMEGFLAARYSVPNVASPTAVKPVISNPEMEFDVNTLALGDGDTVSPWPDQSGQGNDAIAIQTPEFDDDGWLKDGAPCVRIRTDIVPGNAEVSFDGSGFAVQNEITLFLVFRVNDISVSTILFGGQSFTDNAIIGVFVQSDGTLRFTFGTNAGVLAVDSAPGEILQGVSYVVTCTHSSTNGKAIRKKVIDLPGTQVGLNAASTANLLIVSGANMGNLVSGAARTRRTQMMWLSGHRAAASPAEIVQMEEFLAETFLGQAVPPTIRTFPRVRLPERSGALFQS